MKGDANSGSIVRAVRYAVERQEAIRARHAAAESAERAHRDRVAFLGAASERLRGKMDVALLHERLTDVLDLAVPRFGDCCIVAERSPPRLFAMKHVTAVGAMQVREAYDNGGELPGSLDPLGVDAIHPVASPAHESAAVSTRAIPTPSWSACSTPRNRAVGTAPKTL